MSCTSCSTSSNGKPGGCQSNGGCSTGGCNRMNTHDWLRNLPMSDFASACKVIEVTFNQGTRKDFFRNPALHNYEKGDLISVEGIAFCNLYHIAVVRKMLQCI